jgi:hypothetical protein
MFGIKAAEIASTAPPAIIHAAVVFFFILLFFVHLLRDSYTLFRKLASPLV